MPSEPATDRILKVLDPARSAFRSAVIDAGEEVRAFSESHRRPASEEEGTARVAAELGVFAADRIDADLFAALMGDTDVLDDTALRLLDRAYATLKELIGAGDAPFRVDVLPGSNLVADVDTALSLTGRAFGAARIAELVRKGQTASAERDDATRAFPFARWTRAERAMAPPLLVEVDGADLHTGGLSSYLDGAQKIALIVRAPAPPAALARIITPNVFVMQTTDPAAFATFASFAGPGVAALVPEGCATFVHDPSLPPTERLRIDSRPDSSTRALRRMSAFQQDEALLLLDVFDRALNGSPAQGRASIDSDATMTATASPASAVGDGQPVMATAAPAAPAGVPAIEPADRLAAWLLSQAGLVETGQAGS